MKVPSTKIQNNFGKYLKIASELEDVIISRNGKEIARIVSCSDKNHVDEEAVNYFFNDQGKISHEEFLKLTNNTEARYEYIDGQVYLMASPTYGHQIVVDEIYVKFHHWFKGKGCRALTSPFDVKLLKNENEINVVQPDIIVICDTDMVNEKGVYTGVPRLVVEVLSHSTRKRDMLKKLDLYMQSGIKEYWMVDPLKKAVHVYMFAKNDMKDYEIYMGDRVVKSGVFIGLEVKLEEIVWSI